MWSALPVCPQDYVPSVEAQVEGMRGGEGGYWKIPRNLWCETGLRASGFFCPLFVQSPAANWKQWKEHGWESEDLASAHNSLCDLRQVCYPLWVSVPVSSVEGIVRELDDS